MEIDIKHKEIIISVGDLLQFNFPINWLGDKKDNVWFVTEINKEYITTKNVTKPFTLNEDFLSWTQKMISEGKIKHFKRKFLQSK